MIAFPGRAVPVRIVVSKRGGEDNNGAEAGVLFPLSDDAGARLRQVCPSKRKRDFAFVRGSSLLVSFLRF